MIAHRVLCSLVFSFAILPLLMSCAHSESYEQVGERVALAEPTSATAEVDPAEAEAVLMANIRQLTFEGRRAGEGYFSQDGTRMIFQSERELGNPFFQIYVLDLQTGDLQRVSPGAGKTTCAWFHPSQQRVTFASTHEDPQAVTKQQQEIEDRAAGKQKRYAWDYDEYYEIYEKDLQTGGVKRLTDARGYDAEGSLSPDGRLIVFASNRHAYSESLSAHDAKLFEVDKSYLLDIYIMNADGSSVRRLTDVKGYDGGPFFSPDGRRIGWRRFSEDGVTAEIFTMNIDGSDQRQITRMGAMSWAPYHHPSGDYFIFTTNEHGFENFELYIVDVDGRHEPVRVSHTAGFDGLPSFSWDGSKVTWTSRRTPDKTSQIFVADWNDDAARRLLGLQQIAKRQAEWADRSSITAAPATTPEITARDARAHVEVLASEQMEGRLTGTRGERLATAYAASVFERLGLEPAGDNGTYYQEFDFTAGVSPGPNNQLAVYPSDSEKIDCRLDENWRPLAMSQTGKFEPAEVVFAGYGIVAPKTDEFEAYDSFVHLDVEDKWVLAFRFMPEDVTPERRLHLNRLATLLTKARVVRDKGARGLILVSGPTSQARKQLVPLRRSSMHAGVSIPVVSINDELAQKMLSDAGKDLKKLQTRCDSGEPQMGFVIPGVKVGAAIDIRKVTKVGRNCLARLPAGSGVPVGGAVVIGAHIDHLGRGGAANSLAREAEQDQIHYGADDNASGIAGLLEIAEYYADQVASGELMTSRDVIFAAWSGEELGLLGSKHYVERLAEELGGGDSIQPAVAAYLNMDMIGRLDKKLIVNGTASSSVWAGEVERRNVPIGLPISIQPGTTLPTDATSFYVKGVPILSLFTGAHAEYHSPRDRPETLNYPGLAKVARFTALVGRSLAIKTDTPDYIEVKEEAQTTRRMGGRVSLGTVPDYAGADVPGVKLSGVRKGLAAEKAGVKGGDIIVGLAGKNIENIYDYVDAIGALKVGQPAEIVVLRGGERLTLSITPSSRE